MVDIHSHVLYGLDDGAKDRETSIGMLRLAAEHGTTDIVATPHANLRYEFQPEEISRQLHEFSLVSSVPRVHSGCDFHLSFDNIERCIEAPRRFTINQSRYLLVEFSDFLVPPRIVQFFQQMYDAGVSPVITHPERNPLLAQAFSQLEGWIEVGCRLQVTAQSFLGRFGKIAERSARELMKRGLVHFVASDGHDLQHRPPTLASAFQLVKRDFSLDAAERVFLRNPRAVLTGDLVPANTPGVTNPRRWFKLW